MTLVVRQATMGHDVADFADGFTGSRHKTTAHGHKQPRVVPSKRKQQKPLPRGVHLLPGVHKHSKTGACMCLLACCHHDELGCICSSCSGVGHEACVPINKERAKRRAARAKTSASALAAARSA